MDLNIGYLIVGIMVGLPILIRLFSSKNTIKEWQKSRKIE